MIKLSVIIPNYNKERYLEPLLSHLKEQMTDEVEVIVIDDASTDGSMSIIEKYSDVFRIFMNEENKYNSYTRNVGVKNAKGKYITFIDSDDDISPDFINVILETIKSNHDGYFFDYRVINCIKPNDPVEKGINTMVWSKVYKRNVIKDNKILFDVEKFPRGVLSEDYDFNLQFLAVTQDVIKIDYELIYYNWGIAYSVSNSPQYGDYTPRYEVDEEFLEKWF